MDVSEDENINISNKEKLTENSLNEILQATVEKTNISANRKIEEEQQEIEDRSSSDDSIDDNSNDFIKSSSETKVSFSLEKIDSEEMKNDWSEFTDFSKLDDSNNTDSQTKLFTSDPWAPNFESADSTATTTTTTNVNSISNIEENSNKISENWANFDNQ